MRMRKILVASLLLVTILLSACGSKTATPTASTPTVTTAVTGALPGQCEVAPSVFQLQPASAATYAPIGASDHIEGPDTAVMTVIEYSDFT
jgi:ABC-type transport system substrate-binding protein